MDDQVVKHVEAQVPGVVREQVQAVMQEVRMAAVLQQQERRSGWPPAHAPLDAPNALPLWASAGSARSAVGACAQLLFVLCARARNRPLPSRLTSSLLTPTTQPCL